jgi:purine-nucleoside phosphorylase
MTGLSPSQDSPEPNTLRSVPAPACTPGEQYVARMQEAASEIKAQVGDIPKTLIVLGSGLGTFAEEVKPRVILPYSAIPHMPVTQTEGHQGNLIVGTLDGNEVALFQGRVHCHDGLRPKDVAFGVRVMASLGVDTVVITNAAGSINPNYKVGDVMVLNGILSLFLPEDPSFGISHPALGPKFYPITQPFDLELGRRFLAAAEAQGLRAHQGAYAFVPGPRFESAVDIRFLSQLFLGTRVIDAVGMSTVPEVLALKQMRGDEVRILGISVITNVAAGLSESEPNLAEVMSEGARSSQKLVQALRALGKL